jgi:hypothetical protein
MELASGHQNVVPPVFEASVDPPQAVGYIGKFFPHVSLRKLLEETDSTKLTQAKSRAFAERTRAPQLGEGIGGTLAEASRLSAMFSKRSLAARAVSRKRGSGSFKQRSN